jgi:hypothetical protein
MKTEPKRETDLGLLETFTDPLSGVGSISPTRLDEWLMRAHI